MRVAWLIWIAVIGLLFPARGLPTGTAHDNSTELVPQPPSAAKQPDPELDMALIYEQANDYKDAEAHFALAARDANVREVALRGLQRVIAALKVEKERTETQMLDTADFYGSEDLWDKAEESYGSVSTSDSEAIRKRAMTGLQRTLRERSAERAYGAIGEWIKRGAEFAAFLLAVVLVVRYISILLRRRRSIRLFPFVAPTDEQSKRLAFSLAYARASLQDPAASPLLSGPASLFVTLPSFSEDLPEVEDLEIAVAKIPFASLARIFGSAVVEVHGGFDGGKPLGNGYSMITTRGSRTPQFQQWPIRIGAADEQRAITDFAYHVLVEAVVAHAVS